MQAVSKQVVKLKEWLYLLLPNNPIESNMQRIIYYVKVRRLAVVEIIPNRCALIQLVENKDLRIGDPIYGNLSKPGSQTIRNMNTGEDISIIVQSGPLKEEQAIKRAFTCLHSWVATVKLKSGDWLLNKLLILLVST